MIDVGPGKPIWALGVMTGTSMDGVDGAMLETDGDTISAFGPSEYVDFTPTQRFGIQKAIAWAAEQRTEVLKTGTRTNFAGCPEVQAVVEALDGSIGPLAISLSEKLSVHTNTASDGEIAGVHGQTIAHRPEQGLTVQVGLSPDRFPMPLVWDFRTADVDAGGQGAPLAPFFHFALAKYIGAQEPLAFLNIGGVGNVTWVDASKAVPSADGALVAFDTGPGNALVNDWMAATTGATMDKGGAAAAAGQVHADRLATNSGQAYLDRLPPKSLDRNDFHGVLAAMEGLSINDGAATLTAFTAECVAASVQHMPSPPTRWLVCGGGRHNTTMMAMLAERLDAPVDPVEAVGLDGDMLEAQAFAYLAVRVLRGLPTSAPSTTGCREPVSGGRISYPW